MKNLDQIVNEQDDEDDITARYVESKFNIEEDDVPDNAIMSGKQFKILKSKLNLILQFVNDSSQKFVVSGVEFEYLLKSQESRTKALIEGVDKSIDERFATHSPTFDYKIMK